MITILYAEEIYSSVPADELLRKSSIASKNNVSIHWWWCVLGHLCYQPRTVLTMQSES